VISTLNGPKKRLLLGLAMAGVCLIALLWATAGSHPERLTYQGLSLEVWSQQAVQSDTNAVAVLRELGARAVPGLIILLTNDEPFLRKKIWSMQPKLPSILGRFVRRRIRPPGAVGTREAAAFSLGIIGPEAGPAVPALIHALHEPDHRIAWRAAKALGHIGKESIPLLIGTLNDKDASVRQVATYALGEIGPAADAAGSPLMQLLDDRDSTVRTATFYSLMKIGAAVEPRLLERMRQAKDQGRQRAARLLLRYYESLDLGLPALLEMVEDSAPASRQGAITMLGNISAADSQAATTVVAALKDPATEVRLAAIQAIQWGNWKTVSPVSGLTACLGDDSASIREAAARVLVDLGEAATNSIR